MRVLSRAERVARLRRLVRRAVRESATADGAELPAGHLDWLKQ